MKWYYAYLMVEFDLTVKLPVSIGVFSESQNQISTLNNQYIEIASMYWKIHGNVRDNTCFGYLAAIIRKQFLEGLYDECMFDFNGKKWSIEECKKYCRMD